jgi:hypothetical protein
MKQLCRTATALLAEKINYLRRRRRAIKTFAMTRENGVIRHYDTIAIPRTLNNEMYDVRTKRYALGGMNIEIIENVWTREQVLEHVHLVS